MMLGSGEFSFRGGVAQLGELFDKLRVAQVRFLVASTILEHSQAESHRFENLESFVTFELWMSLGRRELRRPSGQKVRVTPRSLTIGLCTWRIGWLNAIDSEVCAPVRTLDVAVRKRAKST